MRHYKTDKMVSLSETLKRPEFVSMLDDLRRRRDELKATATKKVYGDYRHLNDRNLEENNWVHRHKSKYTLKEVPYCGLCVYGRVTRKDDDGYTYSSRCTRCEITRQRFEKLNRLQLPPDAFGMHFGAYEYDSPELRHRIRSLVSWISYGNEEQPKSPSVYIWGQPGNGKTSLLYCLAKEAIFSDLRVKYITHQKLVEQRYASIRGEASNPLDNWLDNIDLLLFDELGGIGGSAHKSSWLTSFNADLYGSLYERWESGDLSIVTTTNLTPRQFIQSIDNNQAVISRFDAMFNEPLRMIGRDRRRTKDLKHWYVDK